MAETLVDCQGLACPHPVLRCKELLLTEQPPAFTVVVDNEAAKQNVTRFLDTQGYAVAARETQGVWELKAARREGRAREAEGRDVAPEACIPCKARIAVFVTADRVGRGDDELGRKLMTNFLSTLPELGKDLWRLILVNSGVLLAVEGSPCLDSLLALERAGVQILVCGTCLDHFKVLDKRKAGSTTNMLDVVTSLQLADKVIQV